jgi:uncharacterized protein (UPF0332 family)
MYKQTNKQLYQQTHLNVFHYVFQQLETEKNLNVACKNGLNRMFEQSSKMEYIRVFFYRVSESLKSLKLIETDKILLYLQTSVILFASKNLTLNIS